MTFVSGRDLWCWTGITVSAVLLSVGCGRRDRSGLPRLGYVDGPLMAPLYVAESPSAEQERPAQFEAVSFGSYADVGYALLAGEIDAGFIETMRALSLLRNHEQLWPIGAIEFPYGATIILRKDLDLRLDDLPGRVIAIHQDGCRLYHQFRHDAERFDIDPDAVRTVRMPFENMIPALESGRVDAIVTRGAHALLAVALDHQILYQNWDVVETDLCCPRTLAQTEHILVARVDGPDRTALTEMMHALKEAGDAPSAVARRAVHERTHIPEAALDAFPTSFFAILTPDQRSEIAGEPPAMESAGMEVRP